MISTSRSRGTNLSVTSQVVIHWSKTEVPVIAERLARPDWLLARGPLIAY